MIARAILIETFFSVSGAWALADETDASVSATAAMTCFLIVTTSSWLVREVCKRDPPSEHCAGVLNLFTGLPHGSSLGALVELTTCSPAQRE
jgi:hypothetical protein